MHILYVTTEYIEHDTLKVYDGGLANYLYKISHCLYEKNYQVSVVVVSDMDKYIKYNGIDVYFVCKNCFKKTLRRKLTCLFLGKRKRKKIKEDYFFKTILPQKIKEINSRNKIDIIQYASFSATGKYPEKDVPSCVRISSYAKLWQKYYNYKDINEIESEETQFKNSRFLYGPSEYIASYIKNDLKLDKEIKIIETPYLPYEGNLNDTLLKALQAQINNNEYILFFGTIGALKGAQEIADSIYSILSKYKNLNLVLIGKQTKMNNTLPVELIKQNAKEFSDRVIWLDKQTKETLIPVIKNAKAVLLPSRADNLPNTCIEAMGLKKIVVGSRGASFEQLINDGENGLLCEANNYKSIITCVDRLMSMSEQEVELMEQKAYERSLTLLPENIVPQVLDYYKYVIENWEKQQ